MKAFCQIPGCNQETLGSNCGLCGIGICHGHSYAIHLSFDTQNFWAVEAATKICRDYHFNKKEFLVRETVFRNLATFPDNRNKDSSMTYRYFYECVVPHIRLPNWVGAEKVFCITCLAKHMDSFNKELNDNFFPVLRVVKNRGLICQMYETCFLDAVKISGVPWRCSDCGKYCCYAHAACCTKCKKNLCVHGISEIDYDSGSWPKVTGGCAEKHVRGRHERHISGK